MTQKEADRMDALAQDDAAPRRRKTVRVCMFIEPQIKQRLEVVASRRGLRVHDWMRSTITDALVAAEEKEVRTMQMNSEVEA